MMGELSTSNEIAEYYENKVILVTGGAGSIGSEITKKVLEYNPSVVRVLDNNETALFELEEELNSDKLRIFYGDVRDKDRLKRAFDNVNIIFHAGALKHVPLCEFNPFDAIKTNIIGTQNVLDVALDRDVEKVIFVSTDKAVNPINVMGASKLLAERLTISSNFYSGDKDTVFSCVRFGNVLNSRGSVIPVFKNQIKNGGPVKITDKEMTRFIMGIPEAVKLILKAGKQAKGQEIFILKMQAANIMDLAEVMIENLSEIYGYSPQEIEIEIIGKRIGEKMYEELMTADESLYAIDSDGLYVLNSNYQENINNGIEYNSDNVKLLSKNEIKDIIMDILIK
jgi:FlaA1/EpsC-like NDP-sugar epimerase